METTTVDDGVLITEPVVAELHGHLADQKRNFGAIQDTSLLLQRVIDNTWGTNKAVRFNDKAGGGWIIDMSQWFNGELLYAQIRTVNGRRALTAVIEADDYDNFISTGEWVTDKAKDPEHFFMDAGAREVASSIEKKRNSVFPSVAPQPKPLQLLEDGEPILIVKVNAPSKLIRCTRNEVAGHVRELLSDGDITEADIEIWSKMTNPRVTVQF